jgi:hypothetical protein
MEMPIVEHDDVVEQLTAEGADEALRHPRSARACGSSCG